MKNILIQRNHTVAFLDILGFKQILKEHGNEHVANIYQEGIRLANKNAVSALDEKICV